MPKNNKFLIIVPVYNEEENIGTVINEIKNEIRNADIVIINDGSNDRTGVIINSIPNIKVIHLLYNLGIGAAVQTGFIYAGMNNYNYAIRLDGDGQHPAYEIKKILQPLIQQEADFVIGSRFIHSHGFQSNYFRRLGIKILSLVNQVFIGEKIADTTSGFNGYNKRVIDFFAKNYPVNYPEPEAIILLKKNNFVIKEVPVKMRKRQGGISSISFWKTGYYMAKVLLSMFVDLIRKIH